MFDVHFLVNPLYGTSQGKVSFLIKLAAFQASGWAET
jgi:hypothetical protein